MAYNGSVELISGIKQANNGTFPLVDASAVRVSDDKRLDAVVSEVAGKAERTNTVLETTLSRGRKSGTTAGVASFAFGTNVEASGDMSHAEGNYTVASGLESHAEGDSTTARGRFSHAEGALTTASGDHSHTEGDTTTASGSDSHAEGKETTASGRESHAEGKGTTASGPHSHAEGYYTTAIGEASHAEGFNTTATGSGSHAEGVHTRANSSLLHVFGRSNAEDPSGDAVAEGEFVEIVGNGSSDGRVRSNARALTWEGNEYLMKDLYTWSGMDSTGGKRVATENLITGSEEKATATKNYPVGSFLIRSDYNSGSKLYKVTAPISVGDSITEGTNVTETTLADELSAIWAALQQS